MEKKESLRFFAFAKKGGGIKGIIITIADLTTERLGEESGLYNCYLLERKKKGIQPGDTTIPNRRGEKRIQGPYDVCEKEEGIGSSYQRGFYGFFPV